MYEDEPSDKVHDVLATAVFGDHPLGRPIIGTRRRDRRRCPFPTSPPTTTPATCRPNIVVAAAGNIDHDALVELVERGRATARRPRPPPRRGARPPASRRALRFHAKETEQYHLCLGAPGHRRAATTAASRCACSTRCSAAPPRRGCSRRCARSAASPTPSSPTRASTPTRARWASTSAPGRTTCGEAMDVIGDRAAPAPGRAASTRDELDAREGEREGPHGPVDGVDAGAHEPARQLRADGRAAADRSTRCSPAIDAVTLDDVAALARRAARPERMSAAGVGGDEDTFRAALERGQPGAGAGGVINVARLRRRRADGGDRLRAPSRAPTTCRWSAAPTPRSDVALAGRARRRRRGRGLHARPTPPSHNARALPRGRRALRDGHHGRRLLRARGRGHRQPLRRAQLRDRRRADDGGRPS